MNLIDGTFKNNGISYPVAAGNVLKWSKANVGIQVANGKYGRGFDVYGGMIITNPVDILPMAGQDMWLCKCMEVGRLSDETAAVCEIKFIKKLTEAEWGSRLVVGSIPVNTCNFLTLYKAGLINPRTVDWSLMGTTDEDILNIIRDKYLTYAMQYAICTWAIKSGTILLPLHKVLAIFVEHGLVTRATNPPCPPLTQAHDLLVKFDNKKMGIHRIGTWKNKTNGAKWRIKTD